MDKSTLDWICIVLVIIGALNWGLVAINPGWDLVAMIAGAGSMISRIIYGLVGLSGLYMIWMEYNN